MIQGARLNALASRLSGIKGEHFSTPLALGEIPEGAELLRFDKAFVVVDIRHFDRAQEDKDVFSVRIHVLVLPRPPFRLIEDFWQNQSALDWIQCLCGIKNSEWSCRATDA